MDTNKLIFAAALLASGCASVASLTDRHYQLFTVQTRQQNSREVTGARCELSNKNGTWFLTTPGTVMIPRSNLDLQVICRRAEHEPGRATVVSKTKAEMYENVLVGGGIGAIVDHNNGSAYEYPETIQIVMGAFRKIETAADAENPAPQGAAPTTPMAAKMQTAPVVVPDSSPPPATTAVAASSDTDAALKKKLAQMDFASYSFKMLRGDACDEQVSEGGYCWWSPPGNYSDCPIFTTLKKCKASYGNGCRLELGKELPRC